MQQQPEAQLYTIEASEAAALYKVICLYAHWDAVDK